jgi:alanine racemase
MTSSDTSSGIDTSRDASAEALAGARLTIDLGALVANWRAVVAEVGDPASVSAVVKADGYGIGDVRAATALAAAGCRTFFVGLPEEGVRLRAAVADADIYILAGLIAGSAPVLASYRLIPVLGSPEEVAEWAAARRAGLTAHAAIHVDTGMNRLGLSLAEARDLISSADLLALVSPRLLVSHLACADTPAHPLNTKQLAAFHEARALFPGVPASLANSAGVFLGRDYHFDLVRPGIALYGGAFLEGRAPLRTVVTAEARVLRVRDGAAGATVGYGATETLRASARLAILGVGYADGFHRAASSRDGRGGARVHVRGRYAPLIGRVSMDLIAVDVTAVPGVAAGDWAELFGPRVPVDEVAAHAGTIGYELLTQLGPRYARRYV